MVRLLWGSIWPNLSSGDSVTLRESMVPLLWGSIWPNLSSGDSVTLRGSVVPLFGQTFLVGTAV